MKVPSAKGNPDLLREIGETFSVIPGIERVTVSEMTGSVILHYDTDHHAAFNERLSQRFLSENQSYRPPTTEIDDLARRSRAKPSFWPAIPKVQKPSSIFSSTSTARSRSQVAM